MECGKDGVGGALSFIFYMGVPKLAWARDAGVPTFIPYPIIAAAKSLPELTEEACVDSGGFTYTQLFGTWKASEISGAYQGPRKPPPSPRAYVLGLLRAERAMKRIRWAAPQDYMCEPQVIGGLVEELKAGRQRSKIDLKRWLAWARAKGSVLAESIKRAEALGDRANVLFHGTGLTLRTHQVRTVSNLQELRWWAAKEGLRTPIIPVLQGWRLDDYLYCWDLYEMAGIHLQDEPVVGVGSVCRRQGTNEAVEIFEELSMRGIKGRMHGFGVKTAGLPRLVEYVGSADAQAEPLQARLKGILLPGHDRPGPGRRKGHKNCANCLPYLLMKRAEMLAGLDAKRPVQRTLWEVA
jgi:hypothetical protein